MQDKERSVRQGEVCEKSSQARPGLVCEAKKVNKVRECLLDKERSVRQGEVCNEKDVCEARRCM